MLSHGGTSTGFSSPLLGATWQEMPPIPELALEAPCMRLSWLIEVAVLGCSRDSSVLGCSPVVRAMTYL